MLSHTSDTCACLSKFHEARIDRTYLLPIHCGMDTKIERENVRRPVSESSNLAALALVPNLHHSIAQRTSKTIFGDSWEVNFWLPQCGSRRHNKKLLCDGCSGDERQQERTRTVSLLYNRTHTAHSNEPLHVPRSCSEDVAGVDTLSFSPGLEIKPLLWLDKLEYAWHLDRFTLDLSKKSRYATQRFS